MATQMIDVTPTWEGVLGMLLAAYSDGNHAGHKNALEELGRMAKLADIGAASIKAKVDRREVIRAAAARRNAQEEKRIARMQS